MALVTLAAMFRDSANYLPRYFAQVAALRAALAERGDQLFLVWVWGDCIDATPQLLTGYLDTLDCEAVLRECHHGVKDYGHTQHPLRFRALAQVGNVLLSIIPADTDTLLYVESDLIWEPADLLALQTDTKQPAVALAFPMLLRADTAVFYDIWAYRIADRQFNTHWPYHRVLQDTDADLVELSGGGSCAVLRNGAWQAAQEIGFSTWDLWPGLVRSLRDSGHKSWLDRRVTVWHP